MHQAGGTAGKPPRPDDEAHDGVLRDEAHDVIASMPYRQAAEQPELAQFSMRPAGCGPMKGVGNRFPSSCREQPKM